MKAKVIFVVLFLSLLSAGSAFGQQAMISDTSLNATICGKCHQDESNMMLGFLKDVSYKAGTILMDLLSHKEVVYFDDETRVKNLESLEDMVKYKGKGFRIYFAEEDGRKEALHVTRFDILQLVDDQDKLALKDVEKIMAETSKPSVLVDVRPGPHYQAGHIEGAVNVPAPAFDKFKKNLPADKASTLVVYGVGGCLSPSVAVNAMAMGYDDVRIYTSGFPEWNKGHYAIASPSYVKKGLTDNSLVVLDLREESEAVLDHLPGAVLASFIKFAEVKDKLPPNKKAPIILYGPHRKEAAAMLLGWEYKKVRLLDGDIVGWQEAGMPTESGLLANTILFVPKSTPGVIALADFKKLASHPGQAMLIDVRNGDEFQEGRIPGSVNIPVDDLQDNLAEIPHDKPVVVFCNSGIRAEIAYNILKNKGYEVQYLDALMQIEKGGGYTLEEK